MRILAIDPGPEQSAAIDLIDGKINHLGIWSNQTVKTSLPCFENAEIPYNHIGIEMVACYGMSVGKEVFETCLWIGRFIERCPIKPQLIYRRDIKLHFCNSARAKDANIRQAILDRFGGKDKAIGKKGSYGPLRNVKSHLWSALAIALFVQDTMPVSSNGQSPSFSVSKRKEKA